MTYTVSSGTLNSSIPYLQVIPIRVHTHRDTHTHTHPQTPKVIAVSTPLYYVVSANKMVKANKKEQSADTDNNTDGHNNNNELQNSNYKWTLCVL